MYKKLMNYFTGRTQRAYLKRRMNEIKNIEGDIVECGVGNGSSLKMLCALAKDRKVWGFDSWEGFPRPSHYDTGKKAIKGRHKEHKMEDAHKLCPNARLIKGFFKDSLHHYSGKIALLHIDCDLYESYKSVLEILYPKVAKGGLILFDEYREDKWPGATKAVNEWFSWTKRDQYGKYYAVKLW